MALIICPECGKQVSDKASVCIHCGFPISTIQNNKNEIFDMIIDSFGNKEKSWVIAYVLEQYKLPESVTKELVKTPGCTPLKGIKEENVQNIKEHFEDDGCTVRFVPSECAEPNPLNDEWHKYSSEMAERRSHRPKCPTCGSTNIKQISFTRKAVGVATLGIFSKSARSQFCCKDCGYKW